MSETKTTEVSSPQDKDVVGEIKALYQEAAALSKYRFVPFYSNRTEKRRFVLLNNLYEKLEHLPNDRKSEITEIAKQVDHYLYDCYWKGRGTPVDEEKARAVWKKRTRIHDLKMLCKENAILVPFWGLVGILNIAAGLHLGFSNLIKSPFKAQLCAFIAAAAVLSLLLNVVKGIAKKRERPSWVKSYLIFMFSFIIGWICSLVFQMAFSVVQEMIPPHSAEPPGIESAEGTNNSAEEILTEQPAE
ncbi:MAG: hypothetical protein IJG60_09365 [Thermoguttaceae bacterium]|nr:hypothetical protein [Thermoguttaceae bacterium]